MAYCSSCGKEIHPTLGYCAACKRRPAEPAPGPNGIPEEVKGWSWGAFLLTWVWAIGNRTWIGLLALVPFLGFIMRIVLGIKGREWAWKNKKWESLEHFNRVQWLWAAWGVGLIVGGVVIGGMLAAITIPAYNGYVQRARFVAVVNTLDRGKPILVRHLAADASTPLPSATLEEIKALAAGNAAITGMDAFAFNTYADIGATVNLGSATGAIYLVSTDGGNTWNCRTNMERIAAQNHCEPAATLPRPELPGRYGLWQYEFAKAMVMQCITASPDPSETDNARRCACVVKEIARVVPQEEVAIDSTQYREQVQRANTACVAPPATALAH